MDRFKALAHRRGVRLVFATSRQEAWVRMADDDLLRVLSNLVENAILYSDRATQVTIEAVLRDGLLVLRVTDEGCGIPEEALPQIFERFYRSDESRARATGGVGLGLPIARALLLKADGVLSVESKVGVGSTFTVTLPQSQGPEMA